MLKRLRDRATARRTKAVEFCEACGVVCDAGCRSQAARERVRDHALQAGIIRY